MRLELATNGIRAQDYYFVTTFFISSIYLITAFPLHLFLSFFLLNKVDISQRFRPYIVFCIVSILLQCLFVAV